MLFVLFSILLYFNFHFCSVRLDSLLSLQYPIILLYYICCIYSILFHYFLFYYVFSTVFHSISHNSILLYSILLLFSCNYIYSYFNLFSSIPHNSTFYSIIASLLFYIILYYEALLSILYSISFSPYIYYSILFYSSESTESSELVMS